MREIKFRAWDKTERIMFDHNELLSTNHYDLILNDEVDFELMQYTGLKDDNGIDLYEGDVIDNLVARWLIIFNTGCFCAKMIDHESKEGDMHIALRAIKGKVKIGNIYENPELL